MLQKVRSFSRDHKFLSGKFNDQQISINNIKNNRSFTSRIHEAAEDSDSIIAWLMASQVITSLSLPPIQSGEEFQRDHILLKFALSEKFKSEFSLLKGLFSLGGHQGIKIQTDAIEKFFIVAISLERKKNSIEYFNKIFQWLEKEMKFKKVIREVVRFEQKVQREQALLFSILHS